MCMKNKKHEILLLVSYCRIYRLFLPEQVSMISVVVVRSVIILVSSMTHVKVPVYWRQNAISSV